MAFQDATILYLDFTYFLEDYRKSRKKYFGFFVTLLQQNLPLNSDNHTFVKVLLILSCLVYQNHLIRTNRSIFKKTCILDRSMKLDPLDDPPSFVEHPPPSFVERRKKIFFFRAHPDPPKVEILQNWGVGPTPRSKKSGFGVGFGHFSALTASSKLRSG